MDKETISQYGWIVVIIIILSILITLATPFGVVIRESIEDAVFGIENATSSVLGENGSGGDSGGEEEPEPTEKPTLSIRDGTLIIAGSSDVQYYEIFVNGASVGTVTALYPETEYDLSGLANATNTIGVVAKAADKEDSVKATITYTKASKLASPTVTVEDGNLLIEGSDDVEEYEIFINGTSVATVQATGSTVEYPLPALGAGKYTIDVVAKAAGMESSDETAVTYEKLSAPLLSISDEVLTISHISGADRYEILVDGLAVTTITATGSYINFGFNSLEAGTYEIGVIAKAVGKEDSEQSTISFTKLGKLAEAELRLDGTTLTIDGQGATSYDIYVDGEKVATITETTYDLSSLEPGTYQIGVVSKASGNKDSDMAKILFTRLEKLTAPTLSISNKVLTISGSGAEYYTVYVDGESVATITGTTYDLSSLDPGTYTIGVVAKASDKEDSSMATVSFTRLGKLATPTLSIDGNTLKITAAGATSYDIYVGNSKVATITETTYDLSSLSAGTYTIGVVSKATGMEDSDKETISYTRKAKLATPTLNINDKTLKISGVTGAEYYTVYANGSSVATITENTYDLSDLDPGTYTIGVVAKATDKEDSDMATVSFTRLEKLTTPSIMIEPNGHLMVTNDTGKEDYWEVYANGALIGTCDGGFDLSVLEPGTYTIGVIAKADGKEDSDMSATETYTKKEKLATPAIAINNATLTISGTADAECYVVYANGSSVATITESSCYLPDYLTAGTYEIGVIAKAAGKENSDMATTSFTLSRCALPAISISGNTLHVTAYATSCDVYVDGTKVATVTEGTYAFTYDLSGLGVGTYTIGVITKATGKVDSEMATIEFTRMEKLATPTLTINNKTLTISGATGAEYYAVYVDGESIATITDATYDLSDLAPGTYTIGVVAKATNKEESSMATISFTRLGKLATPTLSIDGNTLKITAAGATSYDIYVGNSKVATITETTYDLSSLSAGTYTIGVVSKATGMEDSDKETISYTRKAKLATPTLSINDKTLKISGVTGAEYYTVYANGSSIATITETTYDLSDLAAGTYTIGVVAKATDKEDSAMATVEFTRLEKLATPSFMFDPEGDIMLTSVPSGAEVCEVYANGTKIGTITKPESGDTYSLSSLTPGTYTIGIIVKGSGYEDSDMSATKTYTKKAKLETPTLTINNKTLTISGATGAEYYAVCVDGESVATITDATYDLSDLAPGTYTIGVVAKASDKEDSSMATISFTRLEKLPTPVFFIEPDGYIMEMGGCDEVEYWEVYVDGVKIGNLTGDLNVSDILSEPGTYTIGLVAKAAGYEDSDMATVSFTRLAKLATPTLSVDGNTLKITAAGAERYAIYVDGSVVANITTNTYDLSDLAAGTYTIGVVAKATGKEDSDMATKSFTRLEKLETPTLSTGPEEITITGPSETEAFDIYVNGVYVETIASYDGFGNYAYDESYDGETITIGVVAKAAGKADSDMAEVEVTVDLPQYLDGSELLIDGNTLTIVGPAEAEYYVVGVTTPSNYNHYTVCDNLVADASGTTTYDLSGVFDYIFENYGEEYEEGVHVVVVTAYADGYESCDNTIEWEPVATAEISGMWTWNDEISYSGGLEETISFTSNGEEYSVLYAYGSLSGGSLTYGKDGSYTDAFMNGIWENETLRVIDFGSTSQMVSREFYDWFVENATPVVEPEISGKWEFAGKIMPTLGKTEYVTFTSNSNTYSGMTIADYEVEYLRNSSQSNSVYTSGRWTSDSYREIDFGTIPQKVSQEFYDWLVQYAEPVETMPKLATPILSIVNNVLQIAMGETHAGLNYIIYVNGSAVATIDGASYNLSSLSTGTYTIGVVAKALEYEDSNMATISYTKQAKLATPTLNINGNTLNIAATGAEYYAIYVDSSAIANITTNTFDLSDLAAGTYTIGVVAKATGKEDSDMATISYTKAALEKLSKPSFFIDTLSGSLELSIADGAEYLEVYANGTKVGTFTKAEARFDLTVLDPGTYSIYIISKASGKADSDPSTTRSYTRPAKPAAPTLSISGNTLTISGSASYYTIYVDGVQLTTTTEKTYDLSELEVGTYTIGVTAYVMGNGSSSMTTISYTREEETENDGLTVEEIEASPYLYGIGKTDPTYVVAEFNEDYSEVRIFANGGDSDGVMKDFAFTSQNPMYKNRSTLTSLIIEDGVTNIGENAFYNCSKIAGDLIIPDGVTSIGDSAFYYCEGLTSIEIPDGVTRIGNSAFSGCGSLTSVKIPNSVTNIGYGAFSMCTSLTNIEIPDGVTSIESSTFYETPLSSVVIPDGITSIGSSAFGNCRILKSVTIPNSVTNIGKEAFFYCYNLVDIYFNGTEDEWNAITFGTDWDKNTGDYTVHFLGGVLTAEEIEASPYLYGIGETKPEYVVAEFNEDYSSVRIFANGEDSDGRIYFASMGSSPMYDNRATLTSAVIEDGVTNLGYGAFYNCTKLAGDLILPDSVLDISSGAFENCSKLNSVHIGNKVEIIGSKAFYGCEGLTGDLTIPNSVKTIKYEAFHYCSGLNGTLTISNQVSTIESYSFNRCSFVEIMMPNSITKIDTQAFANNANLSDIYYDGTEAEWNAINKYIGNPTYMSWDGRTGDYTVHFLGGVLTAEEIEASPYLYGIGKTKPEYVVAEFNEDYSEVRIFANGASSDGIMMDWIESTYKEVNPMYANKNTLKSVTIENGVTSIGDRAFNSCSKITGSLNIPESVASIGTNAFASCYGFTGDLIIPDSVTSIEFGAFQACGFNGTLSISSNISSIPDYAFSSCSKLTGSVLIPEGVTSIGVQAFSCCSNITSVTIPNGVTNIRPRTFEYCFNLTTITMPNTLAAIDIEVLIDCSSLTDIYFNGTESEWNAITFGSLWDFGTGDYTVHFLGGALTAEEIEASPYLYGIGKTKPEYVVAEFNEDYSEVRIFANGEDSDGVMKGFSLKSPDNPMYANAETLMSVTIENGMANISDYAFANCSSLTGNLIITDSVTSIGKYAFSECSGFNGNLTIPNGVTSIDQGAFYRCSGLTGSLTIPDSITSISVSVFRDCSGLTGNLTIPDGVKSIGNSAFYGCSGFNGNLVIPDSVTIIDNGAFYNCSNLTGNLTIPEGVTSISGSAFYGCKGFTGNLVIPGGVTSIGDSAFCGCSGFTGNLVIPGDVTSIGNYAFKNCTGFTGSLTIPGSVTSIGKAAFQNCRNLTGDLIIPDGVTSIGDSTFYYCEGFNGNLVIPDSVTSIDIWAFYNCSNFTGNLVIPEGVTSIGHNAFFCCSGFTGNLVIPDAVTNINTRTFYGCRGIKSVEIPANVTSIGEEAFRNCSNLTDIYFNSTEEEWNAVTFGSNWDTLTGDYTVHFLGDAQSGTNKLAAPVVSGYINVTCPSEAESYDIYIDNRFWKTFSSTVTYCNLFNEYGPLSGGTVIGVVAKADGYEDSDMVTIIYIGGGSSGGAP